MKKYYLICLGLITALGSYTYAQKARNVIKSPKIKHIGKSAPVTKEMLQPVDPHSYKDDKINKSEAIIPQGLPKSQPVPFVGKETILGFSKYDLQTNATIGRRIARNSDGTLSAVWTYSNQTGSFPDRGTGYNHHDGSSWQLAPSARIENTRTGWPEIITLDDGREMFMCHHPDNNYLMKFERPNIGEGSWSEEILNNLEPAALWPRVAVGGPNKNTIHVVALTIPSYLDGIPYKDLDGALLYSRSTDGGQTWDIENIQLPGGDTTHYVDFAGDSYSIDARGNTVVIVDNGDLNGLTMWRSDDNGTTWERTWVLAPPIPKLDPEKDTVGPFMHGDGTANVLLDHNNVAHVFAGHMFLSNDEFGEFHSFFPTTDGIFYWNETMGDMIPAYWNGVFEEWDVPIARASWIDHNDNGFLDLPFGTDGNGNLVPDINQLTDYVGKGLASYPSPGIDDEGCIYLLYSALTDFNSDVSTQTGTEQHNFRHVYGIKSCDNGCTWSYPRDLTPNRYGDVLPEENVFGTLLRSVDDTLRFLFQRDFTPGLHVQGEEHNATSNDIVYMAVPKSYLDTIPGACFYMVFGETEFCDGDSVLLEIDACASSYAWSTGDTTSSIWVKEHGQITVEVTTPCGVVNDTFELAIPGEAPTFSLSATVADVCNGDTSTISVDSVGVASYMWSTGDTTSWIDVDSAGTFVVTVTNCGGSSVDSITLPLAPEIEIVSTGECVGDTLMVTEITGATYAWSSGDTTSSIIIAEAVLDQDSGYTVTVSLCEVSSMESVEIIKTTFPDQDEILSPNMDSSLCLGNSLIVSAPAGYGYLWSNGATSSSVKLNDTEHSGDISVTLTDGCGGSANSDTISVTIHPVPTTPVVNQDSGAFVASTTESGYKWFINGAEVTGITTQKFTPVHWSQTDGADISVQTVNSHGCWSAESGSIVNVEELDLKTTLFKVFPNPSNGAVTVYLPNYVRDAYQIRIQNILGEIVFESTQLVTETSLRLDLDFKELEKGAYYLTVSNSQDKTSNMFILQ